MKRIVVSLLALLCISVASHAQQEKPVIAVMKFTGQAGSSVMQQHALSVQNAVETGFLKSKRFVVVERSQIDQLVGEMKTQEVMSEAAVAELGKTLGAQFCVLGNLTTVGADMVYAMDPKTQQRTVPNGYVGTVAFQLKLVDVTSSRLVTSEQLAMKSAQGIFGGQGFATREEAIAQAMDKIDGQVKLFIQKQFPVAFEIIQALKIDPKRGEAQMVEILGGSGMGLKKGDRLNVVETNEREVSGRKIKTNVTLGEIRVEEVTGDETSNCKVLSGGAAIKQKLDAGAKINCVFSGVNKRLGAQE